MFRLDEFEEEQVRNYFDEIERREREDFFRGGRRTPLSNNILHLLARLIPPETDVFPHINRDMATSNCDMWDKIRIINDSELINFCDMYAIKRSKVIAYNRMISILTVNKSLNGWWGDLFTTTVTKKSEEFTEKRPEKRGWVNFFGRKKDENG